jgi:glycogen synthase
MRVLELTQRFAPAIGGVEDHVLHLALQLKASGADVRVATTDLQRDVPFERLPPWDGGYPFPVHRYRAHRFAVFPHGLAIAAPSMVLEALNRGTDLIHAHAYGYFPTWAGGFARLLDGAALVITPHSDRGRPSFARKLFDVAVPAFTLRRADRVIAVSQAEAIHLISLGIPEERLRVIPNGVDLGEFDGLPLRDPDPDVLTGLFVGRVYPQQKGLATLVRAVASADRGLSVQFRIVGEDWGGVEAIRRLANELGVADRISFCGKVPRHELLEEYARADFFVLPSLFEPFGIVLLEAMAAGLPVLASRIGGIPEVVRDGESGILATAGDVAELATGIERLTADKALRLSLGRMAQARVRQYSWDTIFPRILKVYKEAIEEREA